MKKLILMQGLPGSGKSRLAHQLVGKGKVLSTDDYFMSTDGEYVFDSSKIGAAHRWNQLRAEKAMEDGCPVVVIDNTNTQAWEARAYVQVALACGYEVEFVRPDTQWANDPQTCFEKTVHGVPLPAIEAMFNRLETLTVEGCLHAKAPWEGGRK